MTDVRSLRLSYTRAALSRRDLNPDPLGQFSSWFEEALHAELIEPYAMSLATADAQGRPSVRTVLLRGYTAEGLSFYSNYQSHKGRDLAANAQVEVLFYWAPLERQVRAYGPVERLSPSASDEYFHSRPYESQLAAHASTPQSAPIADRAALEAKLEALRGQYPPERPVPRPEFWGGYLLRVQEWEFWQGRPNRMHDRFRYKRDGPGWAIERLMP